MTDGRPILVDDRRAAMSCSCWRRTSSQRGTSAVTEYSSLAGVWLINREYQVVKGVPDDLPILNSMMTDDMCAGAAASTGAPRVHRRNSPSSGQEPASFTSVGNSQVPRGNESPDAQACCSSVWEIFADRRPPRASCAPSPRANFPASKLDIDSAGTADYHVGEPPDRRTVAAARRRGYDLAGLRARQVQPTDFSRFDFVLAMDRANLAELERRRPAAALGAASRCSWSSRPKRGVAEVPDPVLRRRRGFRARARPVRSGGARIAGAPGDGVNFPRNKKARTLARAGLLQLP